MPLARQLHTDRQSPIEDQMAKRLMYLAIGWQAALILLPAAHQPGKVLHPALARAMKNVGDCLDVIFRSFDRVIRPRLGEDVPGPHPRCAR